MPKTKLMLEAELRRLARENKEQAEHIEALRIQNYDLRFRLGLDQPPAAVDGPDAPFVPNGNVGAPGYVMDYLASLKAAAPKRRRYV